MASNKRIITDNVEITLKNYSKEVKKEIRKACRTGLRDAGKVF